ncbi:MAG: EamA family transporter [Candidatus Microthrix sp.]|nr:EamA family transporter [Candidatus Microthrix sp.]
MSQRRSAANVLGDAPVAAFILGGISLYVGASLAVGMFDEVGAGSTAWLRLAGASAALLVLTRPWRRSVRSRVTSRAVLGAALAFGVTSAVMNTSFYLAIDHLPLGTAVALEFTGPIGVALWAARTRRNLGAVALASVGVALLARIEWRANAAGLVFVAIAAACWAGYVVLGKRLAHLGLGTTGLTLSTALGTLVLAPVFAPGATRAFTSPPLLATALAVGVFANVVPYGIDQVVLPRLTHGQFALLLAVLPATATLVAAITLRQIPTASELLGIAAVSAGVALRDPPPSADLPSDVPL